MMNKIIKISIILLLAGVAVFGFFLVKNRIVFWEKSDVYSVVAPQTAFVLESGHFADLQAVADGNPFLDALENHLALEADFRFFSQYALLLSLGGGDAPMLCTLVAGDDGNLAPLLVAKATRAEARNVSRLLDDGSQSAGAERQNSAEIWNFPTLTLAHYDGVLMLSPSGQIVRNAVDCAQKQIFLTKTDVKFVELRKTSGKNSLANIFVQWTEFQPITEQFLKKDAFAFEMLTHFSSWAAFDLTLADGQLRLNGYADKNSQFLTNIFAEQKPRPISLVSVAPLKTSAFVHFSLTDYAAFSAKMKAHSLRDSVVAADAFLNEHFAGEVLAGQVDSTEFLMLKILDSTLVSEQFDRQATRVAKISEYTARNVSTYQLPPSLDVASAFGVFSPSPKKWACIFGNVLLLSESDELVRDLAGQISAGYTFVKNRKNQSFAENCASSSVFTFFVDYDSSKNSLFLINKEENPLALKAFGGQFEHERNLVYCTAFFVPSDSDSEEISATPELKVEKKTNDILWQTDFPGMPIFGPVVVRNHVTHEDEILLQGEDRRLHLFSHDGKELWATTLDGAVLGSSVSQIDFYKNEKYQFVLNSAKSIYVIDRKGRMVENFPLALPGEASAPMSVFDYDDTKDYRFFVPCANRKILLFDKTGKPILDWNLKTTQNAMTLPVQFLRIAGKDYLLLNDGARAYFLDRRGNERIRLKSQFEPSRNAFSLAYDAAGTPALLATDKAGYVKKIKFSGEISSNKVIENLAENHRFVRIGMPLKPVFALADSSRIALFDASWTKKAEFPADFSDGEVSANGDFLVIYSPAEKKMQILDALGAEPLSQSLASVVPPFVGQLAPQKGVCALVVSDEKLICFRLR